MLGASSDIGKGLIRQLNEEQSDVVFLAHYHSDKLDLENILMKNRNEIHCLQADFSDKESVTDFISRVKQEYGTPTHLVHLPADKFQYKKLKDFNWEAFLKDAEIQVHSLLEILKVFLPKMAKAEGNSKVVIMLSSNVISAPAKYTLQYNMVKYMLLGVVKSLTVDYADKRVNINGVSPSMMDTKFLSEIDPRIFELNAGESVMAKITDVIPAITFLLSEGADYVKGVNLNISNGRIL